MSDPTPIIDLHCDLLCYLAGSDERSPYHAEARCSFPQLKSGKVFLQTLAVFTETKKGSSQKGRLQFEAFKRLSMQNCTFLKNLKVPQGAQEQLYLIAAIENASALIEEDEPLQKLFPRIDALTQDIGPLLYISMTWNSENRFGGGCHVDVGLKSDGEALLEYMSGKSIAIDFSHTSDRLAYDILNFIDRKNLKVRPIASHSNFRAVNDSKRNLPDDLVLEIVKRGGVIGINFVRPFISGGIGDGYDTQFLKMIEHAKHLGALNHLCFGADFFFEDEIGVQFSSHRPFFVEPYDTAACYPLVINLLQKQLNQDQINAIAYQNIERFFERQSC
jgi:membrane dipeptidase